MCKLLITLVAIKKLKMKNSVLLLGLLLIASIMGYSQSENLKLNQDDFIQNKIESVLQELQLNNQQIDDVGAIITNSRGNFWKLDDYVREQYNFDTYRYDTYRTVFEYDSDWNVTAEVKSLFDTSTVSYELHSKRVNTYNTNSVNTTITNLWWDTLSRLWVLRNYLGDMNSVEAMNFLRDRLVKTRNNDEFLISMNDN